MNCNKIIPGIYLGNKSDAVSEEFFIKNDIKFVINLTPDVPNKFPKLASYIHFRNIDDSCRKEDIEKMTRLIPKAIKYMRENHKNGKNILVHCHAGMQRSAIVVLAYLMYYYNMSLNDGVSHIVSKRPIAFFWGDRINFLDSIKAQEWITIR